MQIKKYVFVLDTDGVMTNGGMWYTKEEKYLKMFGPDDHDAIKEIQQHMTVQFITGDKKGFDIVKKRISDEMHCNIELVSHKPKERWDWITDKFNPEHYNILYMGDGIYDWYSLKNADYSITTADALDHVKDCADYVTKRCGGNRAVAEACITFINYFKIYVENLDVNK